MSRAFLTRELEGVATWWRIYRRDGVALGFTSHDRDLWLAGLLHRAAPGMVPSAIRQTTAIGGDDADIEGVLAHDSIRADDLAAGRFDGAWVEAGVVDWEDGTSAVLFRGAIGEVTASGTRFSAELQSAKRVLGGDLVPRTSPTCRARFCGPGCGLSGARFTTVTAVTAVDPAANACGFAQVDPALYRFGELVWFDGPQAGLRSGVNGLAGDLLVLSRALADGLVPGQRARLRQGCDHTLATCHTRFANAANFQGEPHLPGNDLLARYPAAP